MSMPIDLGLVASVATTEPAVFPEAIALPPEAVAAFAAALERPLAENKAVQSDFEGALKAFSSSVETALKPLVEVAQEGEPLIQEPLKSGEVETLKSPDSPADRSTVQSPDLSTFQPFNRSTSQVATPETLKVVLDENQVIAKTLVEIPKADAPVTPAIPKADLPVTPETLKVVLDENQVIAKTLVEIPKTDAPVTPAIPKADLPVTPETLKVVLDENQVIAKTLVEIERPDLPAPKSAAFEDKSAPADKTVSAEAVASLLGSAVRPMSVEVTAVQPAEQAVEAVAARTVETVARVERVASASEMMVQAAEAVADAILVTPGLMRGEGEIVIRLRPDVLDGSEVKVAVAGRKLAVEFLPQVAETAVLIERNLPQLQQVLAARVHSFSVAVSVRKGRDGRA